MFETTELVGWWNYNSFQVKTTQTYSTPLVKVLKLPYKTVHKSWKTHVLKYLLVHAQIEPYEM